MPPTKNEHKEIETSELTVARAELVMANDEFEGREGGRRHEVALKRTRCRLIWAGRCMRMNRSGLAPQVTTSLRDSYAAVPGHGPVRPHLDSEVNHWRLSFWGRRRDESGEGHRTDIWCTSEREARLRFGEYRRIFESHTLIITRVELLSPSGEKITSV